MLLSAAGFGGFGFVVPPDGGEARGELGQWLGMAEAIPAGSAGGAQRIAGNHIVVMQQDPVERLGRGLLGGPILGADHLFNQGVHPWVGNAGIIGGALLIGGGGAKEVALLIAG